jgi:hypothetical protein
MLTAVTSLAPSVLADWLEVLHIGKTDWRVSDSRHDVDSIGRVLGFVERRGRYRFEILWMTEPPRWAYVRSLAEAIAAFSDEIGFTRPESAEREEAPRKPRREWRRWVR